jgi:hypothetical protein
MLQLSYRDCFLFFLFSAFCPKIPRMPYPPIFDGHNDTLTNIFKSQPGHERSFYECSQHGQLDLPRARSGGLAGGVCAIFTPAPAGSADRDIPSNIPAQSTTITRATIRWQSWTWRRKLLRKATAGWQSRAKLLIWNNNWKMIASVWSWASKERRPSAPT